MKKTYGKSKLAIIFMLLFFYSYARSSESKPTTVQLKTAINEMFPNADILKKEDIDISSCGEKKNPGIVEADFNGDGIKDYAVLLKIGKVVSTVYESEGKKYPWKKLRVWEVVFLGLPKGTFKSIILQKIDKHSFPAYMHLDLLEPGKVQEFDSDRKVTLKYPGIILIYCEKSAVAHYWDEKHEKFEEIWVGD